VDTISGIAIDPEPSTGVIKVEIAIRRLSDKYYWNGIAWGPLVTWLETQGTDDWVFDSSSVLWASGTQYNVQSRATDLGNLVEIPQTGNIFTIDMENPYSGVDIPMNGIWLNRLDEISGYSKDIGGSGVGRVEISLQKTSTNEYWDGANWGSNESWLAAIGTEKWSYNTSKVQWSTGDEYKINSRAIDNTDNKELPGLKSTFKYDASPPEQLSIYINKGNEYTTETNVNLAVYGEDFGSGISDMSFSLDGLIWSAWEPFTSERSYTLPNTDGENTVFFKVRDYANNIGESAFDSIILDTTTPKDLSIMINNGDEYTNSNIVTLTLNAADSESSIGDMTFSFDSVIWQPWEPFKHTKSITFSEGAYDGEKRIYFKVSDIAGNIANSIYESIILDRTPPQSLSVIINDGATEVNSTQVILDLNAVDILSGIYQMSFSTEGETWTSWEAFGHDRSFTLPPGNGEKYIYFKVKDYAGNIATPIVTTIILNTSSNVPSETESESSERSSDDDNVFLLIIVLIVLIIILVIVAYLAVVLKRKKRLIQKLQPQRAVIGKPEPLFTPAPHVEQVSAATAHIQLPSTTAPSDTELLPSVRPLGPAQVPSLKPMVPQVVQAPQLPQLPPAQPVQDFDMKQETSEVEVTPKPTTIPPAPNLKPTEAQTPVTTPSATTSTINTTTTQQLTQNNQNQMNKINN
jgi:hypothetical protein